MYRLLLLCTALLVACSPFEGVSGFGSPKPRATCAERAAPWRAVAVAPVDTPHAADRALNAVTYNLHSGLGPSWTLRRARTNVEENLRGIAQAIARSSDIPPDIVALNEVDFDSRRSGGFNQAQFIADALKQHTGATYTVVSGETWRRRIPGFEVRFGNAVLVRHAVLAQGACLYNDAGKCDPVVTPDGLPALDSSRFISRFTSEARGLIKLTIDFHGRPVDIIITHLDAFALDEREAQASHIVRRFVRADRTTLLLGDINAVPTVLTQGRAYFAADRTHDILTSGALADARVLYAAQRGIGDLRRWATYPADVPVWPLDAILGSLDLLPVAVATVGATESDHRGLAVQYRLSSDRTLLATQRVRHDAIRREQFAQILRCDIAEETPRYAAQARWLLQGTGFLDIASLTERQRLSRPVTPTF